MEFIISIILTSALCLPAFTGLYILLVPVDQLGANYMNMRHRISSFAPLKDEHFGNIRRKVLIGKFFGMLLLAISACTAYLIIAAL